MFMIHQDQNKRRNIFMDTFLVYRQFMRYL